MDWRYLVLALISAFIYAFSYFYKIKISEELLYWMFSSILQSYVALGALVGMIAVFKMQIIHNRIENIASALEDPMVRLRGRPAFFYLPEDILREGNRLIEEVHPASQGEISILKKIMPTYEGLFSEHIIIKSQIIDFIKNVIIVVMFALVFLAFIPLIIYAHFDITSLFIVSFLSILSLVSVLDLIKEIL